MHIVPLTMLSGFVRDPAFLPDGERVAFFWDGEDVAHRFDLYVQLVGGKASSTYQDSTSGSICCADWSPDGQRIAFSEMR
jgi:Tol biopolymer transport system component